MANKGNLTMAPEYSLYRTVVANDGAGPFTDPSQGMCCTDYPDAHIQVLPSAAAVPVVEVLFWSSEASKFISASTKITKASPVAGEAFELTVPVLGRRFFVVVTSGMAGGDTVKISAAGYR